MNLIVKNRDKVIFSGEVDTITSYNKVGLFNVLQDHSNFISIINKKIIYTQRGSTQEIEFDNALLKVKENKIQVYVGIK